MSVHNHPPYRPWCDERTVNGQLRGACLSDDGTPSFFPAGTSKQPRAPFFFHPTRSAIRPGSAETAYHEVTTK